MLSILIPSMDIGPQGRTNYGQNMRGRSALVMIDGVSLNSIRAISRQLDAIDPLILKELKCFPEQALSMEEMRQGVLSILLQKHLPKKESAVKLN
jgi:iron complex outermembrane receptor protein